MIPWRALKAGDDMPARALVRGCKALCGARVLKVIIESGELQEPALIRAASLLAILNAKGDSLRRRWEGVPFRI